MKDLRNNSVFAFFMINALFVLVVFLLQLNKDNLHVKWPFGVKTNITYDETTQEVKLNRAASVLDQMANWMALYPDPRHFRSVSLHLLIFVSFLSHQPTFLQPSIHVV